MSIVALMNYDNTIDLIYLSNCFLIDLFYLINKGLIKVILNICGINKVSSDLNSSFTSSTSSDNNSDNSDNLLYY